MLDALAQFFNTDEFMPHGHCFLWRPAILWLHVVSDILIGVAYYSIPLAIIYFARKRRDLPFGYLYTLFSLFIVLCGSTHFFSVWSLWNPDYGPEGLVKALTALASITTAIIIWRIMPVALKMPSPAELQEMNEKLKRTNFMIEQEVTIRTAQLRDSERKLLQAQKMEAIGSLTGGMAHDFNNLLGVIIGNLDSLNEALTDGKAKQLSQEALEAALRGADLNRRLLAFARQQPLQSQNVDINTLIVNLTKLLSRTLSENIQISLNLSPEVWTVVIDPVQLESSLTNLATNARDAMPKGGRLIIATSNQHLDKDYAARHAEVSPGDYVMIEVTDTGIGMAPDMISHIFEPFFTTKERGKGTGLGLSMVFGFMKQSKGHINVYSEPGIGTTFRLYLPRAEKDAIATGRSVGALSTQTAKGHETILVVEDNEAVRRVVMRQLSDLGYKALETESATGALDILGHEKIDLMFTDIIMPGGLDGLELARIANERWPSLKIILTSGFPDAKIDQNPAVRNLRLLSKPYRKEDLGRILREVLEGNGR